MAPRRLITRPIYWAGRWTAPIILILMALCLVMLIVAISGYTKARDAQRRVNQVEVQRALEMKAAEIDRVSTCFRTAAVRPQVVEIFEALANQQEFAARTAVRKLIQRYEAGTPTRAKCIKLALDLDIDPAPFVASIDR